MILAFIVALVGFLFSIQGLTALLAGVMLFICLPFISTVSRFKGFSRFFLRLAALPLRRAAFVVSEHDDILFKQMRFDSLGYETITLDGDTKVFEDPDASLHNWLGMSFALADEEHGVLFDPRHAALGKRKREHDDNGRGEYHATDDEWETYGIEKWKPGVFEFPTAHELVNLSNVQELIDGGERSEFAERVEELYQHSRAPLQSGSSGVKFLMPILAFGLLFGGIWVMSSQLGGPSSTVSYSIGTMVSTLAALPFIGSSDGDGGGRSIRETLASIDWGLIAGLFLLTATPVAAVGLLIVLLGPIYGLVITTVVLMGMALLPVLTLIAQPSALLGGALSKLYFRLGFIGYRRPVLEWTPTKYRLREYDQLETTDDVNWYDGPGGLLGFSFSPEQSSWDAEVVPHTWVESRQPVTDGGTDKSIETNLPAGYVGSPDIQRDRYGGFLPTRVRDNCYYVRTGIALNRFAHSANGEKSLRKLLEAKQEHGTGNEGIDDATVFKATLVSGALGAISGIGVFLLPAFL